MSNTTPAGWYPDPENPGQNRYWDGVQWAAPTEAPTAAMPVAAAPPGGGGGGPNRTVLMVVAIVAALALVGGGAWAFTRDGGDDSDDEVATEDVDEEDADDPDDDAQLPEDDEGTELLDEEAFFAEADRICWQLLSDLESGTTKYFDLDASAADIEAAGPEVRQAYIDETLGLLEASIDEFRELSHPDSAVDENFQTFVEHWYDTYAEYIPLTVSGSTDLPGRLAFDLDTLPERATDFGLSCFTGPPPDDSGLGGGAGDTGGGAATTVDAGSPTAPPELDDDTLASYADLCYIGVMEACDSLYLETPVGSPGEEYGLTCGGRTDGTVYCQEITDPALP